MAYDLEDLARELGSTSRRVAIAVGAVTREAAAAIQRDARAAAPVDTGRLKASITVGSDTAVTGLSIRSGGTQSTDIGPEMFYGGLVEQGTSRLGPKPYLRPAFERHAPVWVAAVTRILDQDVLP